MIEKLAIAVAIGHFYSEKLADSSLRKTNHELIRASLISTVKLGFLMLHHWLPYTTMPAILSKIIQTSGAKIYAVLLSIIAISITARWLGPEGRGIVATISTWVLIFTDIGDLSLSTVLVFKASKKRGETWLSGAMGMLSVHTIIITAFSWSLIAFLYVGGHYLGLPNLFGETPLIPLIVGFITLPLILWDAFTKSLLNIEDKLNVYNKYQIIGSTSNAFSIVLLVVVSGLGVLGVLLSKLLWQAVVAWGGIKELLKRKTGAIHFKRDHYKDLLTDGMKMHLNIIGAVMLTNIDIVMVSAYLGNAQTGIYQMAVQTSLMMMIVPYAVMTVLQGELSRKGVHAIWGHQKKLLFLTLAFMIGAALFTGFTAKWWLLWLAGEEFAQAVTIFQYLLVWVVVSTATAILSVQWIGRGYFLQLSFASILTGTLNIGLNALLIPKYGVMGAVWATMGTAVLALLINIGMYIFVELDNKKRTVQAS